MPPLTSDRLHLGAAYYPEHWPEERWPEDIRLMREAGFTVARLAEFAWSTMEPRAGDFHFDWLDRAIAALAEAGIASVLGTPTAAPPAWLVQQHPDLLTVKEDGRRIQFGNRCHYCVNSPDLQTATQRIVLAMAKHFGPNPHVIGWQFDNEYNQICYCDRCRSLFQKFLAEKFGSLDALNHHWSTAYWSQTYSAWEQIPLPIGYHNPGLRLAFSQFITESYRRFQRLQLDILRPHLKPGVWTTHNFMGWYDVYDHYTLTEDLDLVSWDWYIGTGHHTYLTSGAIHDLTRGFKRQNFWLIETQPAMVNWSSINNPLNKGETRVMAWHAVAHGADGVLYWQWRSASGGQEQYHGSLLDQSGQPRPFYAEAQQLGRDFSAVSALLAGSVPVAEVCLLNCYPSRWAVHWQRHHRDFSYIAHFEHYYRPLAARNVSTEIISADAPLENFKVVIAPALHILNEKRAATLKKFVESGGHLVLTLRSGLKDDYNALLPVRQPGPLAALAGVEVEEYYALDEPVPVSGEWFSGTATIWAERLKLREDAGTQVLALYGASNGWLDGHPAVTMHAPAGQGRVYFVAAYLDEASQQSLINRIVNEAGVKPLLETPAGVEARKRVRADGQEVFILINHERAEQSLRLPWPADEHLHHSDLISPNELKLPPYGVAVLTRV